MICYNRSYVNVVSLSQNTFLYSAYLSCDDVR